MSLTKNQIYVKHERRRAKALLGLYGDGADGDATLGSTTLTRDMYYNSLTVNAGATIATGGFRIFSKQFVRFGAGCVLDNSGYRGDVVDGLSPTGGGMGAPQTTYLTTVGMVRGGGDGGGDTADGESISGLGGWGGGGAFSLMAPGGAGGHTTVATSAGGVRYQHNPFMGVTMSGPAITLKWGGGAGGGGGGGGGGVEAYTGGNGGGGGGVIIIACPAIVGPGTIRVKGGDGTDGSDVMLAGGGGGGGGGAIIIVTENEVDAQVTYDVSGGTGASGPDAPAYNGESGNVYIFRTR